MMEAEAMVVDLLSLRHCLAGNKVGQADNRSPLPCSRLILAGLRGEQGKKNDSFHASKTLNDA